MYPFRAGLFAVRNAWYVAAFSDEVGRALLERWVLDEPVLFYRREDGTAVALAGRCPHRQFPLAAGRLEGDTVICGYHGIEFGADGQCLRIPTQAHVPPAFRVGAYPLVERWRWLWIWMGDPNLADEALIPDHQAIGLGAPEYSSAPMHHNLVKGRAQLLNDNLLDLSHLTFLHSTKIGTDGIAATREEVTSGPRWIRSRRDVRETDASPLIQSRFGKVKTDLTIDFTYYAPALHVGVNRTMLARSEAHDPGRIVNDSIVYHAVTPATKHSAHYFFARSARTEDDVDGQASIKEFIAGILEEDIFATEEIERIIQGGGRIRDLMTGGDVAVTKGRLLLQRMMDAEGQGAALEEAAE